MINKIKKLFLLIATFSLVLTSHSIAADKHKFKMAASWGGGPLMEIGAKAFATNVDKMSNGRIQIEVFPAGTLGPGLKVSETVKNGVGATVAYVPVGSYSAVGVDGVAYVIANDKSISKEMICEGEAAETTFCK